jgi:hypothetical protein
MFPTKDVECPTCHECVAVRINRDGFLQQKVLSRFGIYPWKCGACGTVFLFRKRGHSGRRRHASHSSSSGTRRRA